MSWSEWANGTLRAISAPVEDVNLNTLWAWSVAESGTDVMRWNNPLNTTQPWPGSTIQNSVGVRAYRSVTDGIAATSRTLLNGYYPVIVAHLRRSLPRQDWGDACANLGTWGTGCAWITRAYGAAPGTRGGGSGTLDDVPTQAEWNATQARVLTILHTLEGLPNADDQIVHPTPFEKLITDVAALKAGGGGIDLTALAKAVADELQRRLQA